MPRCEERRTEAKPSRCMFQRIKCPASASHAIHGETDDGEKEQSPL